MTRRFITLKSFNQFKYPIISNYKAAKERTEQLLEYFMPMIPEGKLPVFYGTGTSGAMILCILKELLHENCNTILINSDNQSSNHRGFMVGSSTFYLPEYSAISGHFNDPKLYHIFVDDLVASGRTLQGVYDNIEKRVAKFTGETCDIHFDVIMTLMSDYRNSHQFENSHFITID